VTAAKDDLAWDVTAVAAAQSGRPIVDIFTAEIPGFSKYRLAKAFLRRRGRIVRALGMCPATCGCSCGRWAGASSSPVNSAGERTNDRKLARGVGDPRHNEGGSVADAPAGARFVAQKIAALRAQAQQQADLARRRRFPFRRGYGHGR
jgi:hypothetical protein